MRLTNFTSMRFLFRTMLAYLAYRFAYRRVHGNAVPAADLPFAALDSHQALTPPRFPVLEARVGQCVRRAGSICSHKRDTRWAVWLEPLDSGFEGREVPQRSIGFRRLI